MPQLYAEGMIRMIGDNLKVAIASGTGIGNWALEIDVLLKIAVSAATLFYIILKCRELWNKQKQ